MEAHILKLDKPRKLKYGFKALKAIKEKFGKDKTLADVLNVEVDDIPYFAWVGLAWGEDKDLTPEAVEDLIESAIPETYTMIGIVNIIVQAISDQVGVPKKKAATKKKTPSRTTVKLRTKSGSPQKRSSKT